jgi:hypothetical protein
LKNEVRRDNPAALASVAVFGGFTLGAMVWDGEFHRHLEPFVWDGEFHRHLEPFSLFVGLL